MVGVLAKLTEELNNEKKKEQALKAELKVGKEAEKKADSVKKGDSPHNCPLAAATAKTTGKEADSVTIVTDDDEEKDIKGCFNVKTADGYTAKISNVKTVNGKVNFDIKVEGETDEDDDKEDSDDEEEDDSDSDKDDEDAEDADDEEDEE